MIGTAYSIKVEPGAALLSATRRGFQTSVNKLRQHSQLLTMACVMSAPPTFPGVSVDQCPGGATPARVIDGQKPWDTADSASQIDRWLHILEEGDSDEVDDAIRTMQSALAADPVSLTTRLAKIVMDRSRTLDQRRFVLEALGTSPADRTLVLQVLRDILVRPEPVELKLKAIAVMRRPERTALRPHLLEIANSHSEAIVREEARLALRP